MNRKKALLVITFLLLIIFFDPRVRGEGLKAESTRGLWIPAWEFNSPKR